MYRMSWDGQKLVGKMTCVKLECYC